MKRKTKKRILLYVIAAILVVCGIFAYQTNKRSAEKKAQKEAMKNQIKTIDDLDGKKIGVQIGTRLLTVTGVQTCALPICRCGTGVKAW